MDKYQINLPGKLQAKGLRQLSVAAYRSSLFSCAIGPTMEQVTILNRKSRLKYQFPKRQRAAKNAAARHNQEIPDIVFQLQEQKSPSRRLLMDAPGRLGMLSHST